MWWTLGGFVLGAMLGGVLGMLLVSLLWAAKEERDLSEEAVDYWGHAIEERRISTPIQFAVRKANREG